MQLLAPTLVLAPLALAASVEIKRASECTDTHIFIAKGNNEPYPGRQGVLVNAICSGLSSCDYEDILYYNPVEAPFCDSVTQGVSDGIAQITAYNARCPNTKLVVSGYSQGAQIVTDILGGGGGVFFQGCVEPASAGLDINSAPGNKIAAALVFGNTRHTAGQSYNVLTGVTDGIFPRTGAQLAGLATWSSKLHDYCVSTDPICAGGDIVETHLNYFDIYTNTAAAWVQSMLKDAAAATTTTSIKSSTIAASPTPYPTIAAHGNTTSLTSILVIPTTTATYVVTVPCASVATQSLTAYSTFPTAKPTSAGGKNGTAGPTSTPVPFTGAATSQKASLGAFGLFLLGALGLVL